jgi:hypothetical protein
MACLKCADIDEFKTQPWITAALERPLAVSLGLGAICQGPRSPWCSEKSSDQNSALENVIDWLKSAIHISA